MSSRRYATALIVEPRADRPLRVALVSIHLIALISLGFMGLSALWLGLGCLAVTASGISCWCRRLHDTGSCRIRRAVWDAKGEWWLETGSGDRVRSRLRGEGLVTGTVIVLNFKADDAVSRTLLLRPGLVDTDTLRRLRARLRTTYLGSSRTSTPS